MCVGLPLGKSTLTVYGSACRAAGQGGRIPPGKVAAPPHGKAVDRRGRTLIAMLSRFEVGSLRTDLEDQVPQQPLLGAADV